MNIYNHTVYKMEITLEPSIELWSGLSEIISVGLLKWYLHKIRTQNTGGPSFAWFQYTQISVTIIVS